MCTWSKKGTKLSAQWQLHETANVTEIIAQYKSFLQQWQYIKHPLIFSISQIEMDRIVSNEATFINCTITVNNGELFSPANDVISRFSAFDKLSLIKQLIDLNHFTTKNKLKIAWHLSQLYINVGSMVGFFLPPTAEQWWKTQKNVPPKNYVIHLLLQFFDISHDITTNTTNNLITTCHNLEKSARIPWGWSHFIENYLHHDDSDKDAILFSAIFHKIWLYRTASRLGMKDKLLKIKEYKTLHQFGQQLDLSEQQMEYLDVMAQQYSHQTADKSWIELFLNPSD